MQGSSSDVRCSSRLSITYLSQICHRNGSNAESRLLVLEQTEHTDATLNGFFPIPATKPVTAERVSERQQLVDMSDGQHPPYRVC